MKPALVRIGWLFSLLAAAPLWAANHAAKAPPKCESHKPAKPGHSEHNGDHPKNCPACPICPAPTVCAHDTNLHVPRSLQAAMAADSATTGLWRMNEDTGAWIVDAVSGRSSNWTGDVSRTSSEFGKALSFQGKGSGVELGTAPTSPNWTLEAILKQGVGGGWILNWGSSDPSGILVTSNRINVPEFGIHANLEAPEGTGIYLALSVKAGLATLHINGAQVATGVWTGSTPSHLSLGSMSPNGGPFDGQLDEFRLTSKARDSVEIAKIARTVGLFRPLSPSQEPTGHWSFTGYASSRFGSTCGVWPANTPFTIEYWVKPTANRYSAIIGTYQDMGETRTLNVAYLDSLRISSRRTNGVGWYALHPDLNPLYVQEADTLPLNTWSHAAFVYTGTEGILYLNGVEKARKADGNTMACGSAADLILFADGVQIDNIRVSTVARYTSRFTPPTSFARDPSTAFLWTFDQPTTPSLADEAQGFAPQPQTTPPVRFIPR